MRVAITGATGFVGRHLIEALKGLDEIETVAISRRLKHSVEVDGVEWRRCEAFSLSSVYEALEDIDIVIYLLHSMGPTAQLDQGSFREFDYILADNYAKACHWRGVKKIIYLGGIIPDTPSLSHHLESRLEVEQVLAQYGNHLTVLRAGLIIGADGSSFEIMLKLTQRLKFMICPSWTQTLSQPVDIDDTIRSIRYCISNSETTDKVYDIGGPDCVSYVEMMALLAKRLGKKRYFLKLNVLSPGLSKLWVSVVTGTSRGLVYPLVHSLKLPMLVGNREFMEQVSWQWRTLEESLDRAVERIRFVSKSKNRTPRRLFERTRFHIYHRVRSVQRLPAVGNRNARWVMQEYFRFLPQLLNKFVQVDQSERQVRFRLFGRIDLMVLESVEDRRKLNREILVIREGLLVSSSHRFKGKLEFRQTPGTRENIIGVHDFRPSLPWFVYKYTQAVMHLFVMWRFGKHLKRLARSELS